jgi:dihydroorotate dehydrogenase (NAD+) catalytic subunit
VIGIGGITTAKDALEFLIAGASAVQVGTANFFDPMAPIKIVDGLREYCSEQGISSIKEIIGSLTDLQHGEYVYY